MCVPVFAGVGVDHKFLGGGVAQTTKQRRDQLRGKAVDADGDDLSSVVQFCNTIQDIFAVRGAVIVLAGEADDCGDVRHARECGKDGAGFVE